ncbi:hypothetical protein QR680_004387 [Steinernema hermaphroditum]|uniref:Nuclear receptor domain-containing protein n=1 Tax=Steinernema hermaphroditum TaxID=289476 RepID=A0AA39HNK2_9BILA|nr:hypothetical protein QR680_004387 [Steinernema hermaphroditum]
MPEAELCPVCFKQAPVCYNFGGVCCRSCAAFFRRAIRSGKEPTCARNQLLCNRHSVTVSSGNNIGCKKCRLDRCFVQGMRPKFVHYANPKTESWVQTGDAHCKEELPCLELDAYRPSYSLSSMSWNCDLPILSGVTKALKEAYRYRRQVTMDVMKHRGTSESGERFCHFGHHRFLLYDELKVFHYLMDRLPIIGDLDEAVREQMFKNTVPYYSVFIRILSNIQQGCADKTRFYPYPNVYVDLEFYKMIKFLMPRATQGSLCKKPEDLADVAELLISNAQYGLNHGVSVAMEVIRTEEDLAALLLLIVILANDFNKTDKVWYEPISQLKDIWKDLDLHYRTTHRDPSAWGNLILFLSNLETINENNKKFTKIMHFLLGSSLFDYIEKSRRFHEIQLQKLQYS